MCSLIFFFLLMYRNFYFSKTCKNQHTQIILQNYNHIFYTRNEVFLYVRMHSLHFYLINIYLSKITKMKTVINNLYYTLNKSKQY